MSAELTEAEKVAEVLGVHRLHPSMNICTGCDWRAVPDAGSLRDQHEAHLGRILAERVALAKAEALREAADDLDGERVPPWIVLRLRRRAEQIGARS